MIDGGCHALIIVHLAEDIRNRMTLPFHPNDQSFEWQYEIQLQDSVYFKP